jgi:predicted transcriptional regulator
MRKELSEAVAGLVSHVSASQPDDMTDDQVDQILQAADIVTLARTGVEIDYRGDVIDAHAPEMPTRFARQLTQVLRGAQAIGMDASEAMELVIRCARDSMPPLRLAILEDIGKHPDSRIIDVRRRLQRPRATADRALQALHVLGLLTCREEEDQRDDGPRYVRHYSLSPTVKLTCLYQICQYSERRRGDKGAKKSTSPGGRLCPP